MSVSEIRGRAESPALRYRSMRATRRNLVGSSVNVSSRVLGACYGVEISPLPVATIHRLPQRTME